MCGGLCTFPLPCCNFIPFGAILQCPAITVLKFALIKLIKTPSRAKQDTLQILGPRVFPSWNVFLEILGPASRPFCGLFFSPRLSKTNKQAWLTSGQRYSSIFRRDKKKSLLSGRGDIGGGGANWAKGSFSSAVAARNIPTDQASRSSEAVQTRSTG